MARSVYRASSFFFSACLPRRPAYGTHRPELNTTPPLPFLFEFRFSRRRRRRPPRAFQDFTRFSTLNSNSLASRAGFRQRFLLRETLVSYYCCLRSEPLLLVQEEGVANWMPAAEGFAFSLAFWLPLKTLAAPAEVSFAASSITLLTGSDPLFFPLGAERRKASSTSM